MSSIKEAEHDADDANQNHLQSAPINKGQSHDTRQTGSGSNSLLHGIELHPPHRTCATRTKARLNIIRAVGKIEEVVDEVGINLHDEGKEADLADFVKIYEPSESWGSWVKHTVDLSACGGGQGYVAFRYNDSADNRATLLLDDVAVYSAGEWQECETPATSTTFDTTGTSTTFRHLGRLVTYELQIIGIKDGFPDAPSDIFYFTTLGYDLNDDYGINMKDVKILVDVVVGKTPQALYPMYFMDVNGDGRVSIADVTALVSKLIKSR